MPGSGQRMRAAFVPAPGRIEVDEFPLPVPGEGQVLVQMTHASVCGSDVHMVFDGFQAPDRLGVPGYPGHEGVGLVVDSKVSHLRPGARVLTVPPGRSGGCFAEYAAVDARHLVPLPSDGASERLLMAQQLGTTVFALKRFLRHPETRNGAGAAVIGTGSSGLFFVQQLLSRGYRSVVVCDLNADRLRQAALLGATHTVHGPARSPDFEETVRDATGGKGADLVIEAAGYDECRAAAVTVARDAGTVGFFGYPEALGDAPFPVNRAFRKRLTMEWINGTQDEPGLASFRTAIDHILSGEIDVDYCLRTTYGIDDVPEALAVARAHGHGMAKVNVTLPAGVA